LHNLLSVIGLRGRNSSLRLIGRVTVHRSESGLFFQLFVGIKNDCSEFLNNIIHPVSASESEQHGFDEQVSASDRNTHIFFQKNLAGS